jgi:hypothetical protein
MFVLFFLLFPYYYNLDLILDLTILAYCSRRFLRHATPQPSSKGPGQGRGAGGSTSSSSSSSSSSNVLRTDSGKVVDSIEASDVPHVLWGLQGSPYTYCEATRLSARPTSSSSSSSSSSSTAVASAAAVTGGASSSFSSRSPSGIARSSSSNSYSSSSGVVHAPPTISGTSSGACVLLPAGEDKLH